MTKTVTTVSWRNLTKPTPQNLLRWASFMRRAVTLVAGTTIVMESNKWVPVAVLGAGFLLDEAKNLFADIATESEDVEVKITETTNESVQR